MQTKAPPIRPAACFESPGTTTLPRCGSGIRTVVGHRCRLSRSDIAEVSCTRLARIWVNHAAWLVPTPDADSRSAWPAPRPQRTTTRTSCSPCDRGKSKLNSNSMQVLNLESLHASIRTVQSVLATSFEQPKRTAFQSGKHSTPFVYHKKEAERSNILETCSSC